MPRRKRAHRPPRARATELLPLELWQQIADYIDLLAVTRLSQTCTDLRRLTYNNRVIHYTSPGFDLSRFRHSKIYGLPHPHLKQVPPTNTIGSFSLPDLAFTLTYFDSNEPIPSTQGDDSILQLQVAQGVHFKLTLIEIDTFQYPIVKRCLKWSDRKDIWVNLYYPTIGNGLHESVITSLIEYGLIRGVNQDWLCKYFPNKSPIIVFPRLMCSNITWFHYLVNADNFTGTELVYDEEESYHKLNSSFDLITMLTDRVSKWTVLDLPFSAKTVDFIFEAGALNLTKLGTCDLVSVAKIRARGIKPIYHPPIVPKAPSRYAQMTTIGEIVSAEDTLIMSHRIHSGNSFIARDEIQRQFAAAVSQGNATTLHFQNAFCHNYEYLAPNGLPQIGQKIRSGAAIIGSIAKSTTHRVIVGDTDSSFTEVAQSNRSRRATPADFGLNQPKYRRERSKRTQPQQRRR